MECKRMNWKILAAMTVGFSSAAAADYPAPPTPRIADGAGYVAVPGALVPINRWHSYKAIIVFHGPSVDGLLKNDGYKTKFGVDNPNLNPGAGGRGGAAVCLRSTYGWPNSIDGYADAGNPARHRSEFRARHLRKWRLRFMV